MHIFCFNRRNYEGCFGIFFAAYALISPLTSSANEDIACEISKSRFWNGGSKINITVSNLSNQSVGDWFVEISYPDDSTIVKHWKAERAGDNPALFSKIARFKPMYSILQYDH